MLHRKTVLIVVALATLACSRLLGDEAQKAEAHPVMSKLLFQPDQLPESCTILKPKPGDVMPFGKGNPLLSADREFIEKFSAMMFPKESQVQTADIVEALFSVYRSTNEIGVFAWRFRTEDAARAAAIAVQKKFKETGQEDGKSVYRTKDVFVFVWHDDSDDPAAPRMRALVQNVLVEYGKQKSKADFAKAKELGYEPE